MLRCSRKHVRCKKWAVTQEFPKAVYTWCSSHKLNLCVVKSCDITEVRNMIDKATEVAIFFNYSPHPLHLKTDRLNWMILGSDLPSDRRHLHGLRNKIW